jgi:hypothetical protein
MSFETYLSDLPKLHFWDGHASTGGFDPGQLRRLHGFIEDRCPPGMSIIETGAGNSTITFLHLSPQRLVSIAPDQALFERIRSYCIENDIEHRALEAHVGGSEWVLPKLAADSQEPVFDFALIDGQHNWPTVMVDFFYMYFMLKRGGYIMLDDVPIHSVKELARLLMRDVENFRPCLDLKKSLVFEKISDRRELGNFETQTYIVEMSRTFRHHPASLGLWTVRPKMWLSSALLPARLLARRTRQLTGVVSRTKPERARA